MGDVTNRPSLIPFWILPLCTLLTILATTLAINLWSLALPGLPRAESEAMKLVYNQILEDYVEPRDGSDLMFSAIEGMVDGLDKHSEFIRPAKVRSFEEATTGTYEGIGIVMVPRARTILFPFSQGPAELAGFRVGDKIMAVDGASLEDVPAKQLNAKIRKLLLGPPSSTVTVSIKRDSDAQLDLEVTRSDIQKPSVKWARLLDPEQRLGYIYLSRFQQDSSTELDLALEHLHKHATGELHGLILDLRFNRGGLLDEAVALTSRFLRKGTIVTLKSRGSHEIERHEAKTEDCAFPELPLVILMNSASASASEVTAGALQDHGRARVVGTRSYGKGVVQSIFRWQGTDFRLKLTTSHYYTPNGRSIERQMRREEDGDAEGGIDPDREVLVSDKERQNLRDALGDWEVPPRWQDDARELCMRLSIDYPQPLPIDQDKQLAEALDELRSFVQQKK